MKRKLFALVAVLAVVAAACGGGGADTTTTTVADAGGSGATEEPMKVAFVYVAPIGDLGWTFQHDLGREAVEAKFGNKVETTFIENVAEGPDSERVIRDFANKGFDLIIATSFGYMDPTITVAAEFPETQFVHISGYKNAPNVSTVFGRMYQPRYLSGIAAGAATESNILGYVAAFPIPEVIRGINAFTLGAQSVNPDVDVRVVWTNTWFDPPTEKEAAEALLAAGADVIAQHQDTTEPQKAAQAAGAVSISYNSDISQIVGDSVLTGPVWDWGVKYISIIDALMAGTYDGSESYWGGLDDGIISLAPFSDRVSQETQDTITAKMAEFQAGTTDVFCGPIVDVDGTEQVAAGSCMDDGSMLGIEWFVKGVSQ